MPAPTEYYVSPPSGNDTTGDGSIGTPWATVQKALNTITRNTTSGDRINVQTGGTDTLSTTLSIVTYGTPTDTAPLIIQGYTTAAGDGGQGVISGGAGAFALWNTSANGVILRDMRWTNAGDANTVQHTGRGLVEHCEFDTQSSSSRYLLQIGTAEVFNCYFHNYAGRGIIAQTVGGTVKHNVFDGTDHASAAGYGVLMTAGAAVEQNLFICEGGMTGVYVLTGQSPTVSNNTFYSSSGTGAAIRVDTQVHRMLNNYAEGFSGAGGKGVLISAGADVYLYGHNKFYNNTAHETLTGDVIIDLGNNDTLGSSGLTAPGSGDYSATTALKALGYPSSFYGASTDQFIDVGAAQREEAAAGGGDPFPSQGIQSIESGIAA